MRPGAIAAVGQSAARMLPPGTRVLRHPANGGGRKLTAGLGALADEFGYR
jgi:hypothetical protein